MKKTLLTGLGLSLLLPAISQATISINWDSQNPLSSAINNGVASPVAQFSTILLIWSPDSINDGVSANTPGGVLVPGGNDIVLDIRQNDSFAGGWNLSGTYEGENYGQGADGLVSGYVFQRVIETPYNAGSPSPSVGDWWDDSPLGPVNRSGYEAGRVGLLGECHA